MGLQLRVWELERELENARYIRGRVRRQDERLKRELSELKCELSELKRELEEKSDKAVRTGSAQGVLQYRTPEERRIYRQLTAHLRRFAKPRDELWEGVAGRGA